VRELYPVLLDILAWHRRGTRYDIHVCARDHLLFAGEAGVQLTWMDARVGDWVVTPRTGKAVEINALWQHALVVTRTFADVLGDSASVRQLSGEAERHADSFTRRFWNADAGYLYEVIDVPPDDADDDSLRPNQIIAVALGDDLLSAAQRRAIVDICQRELWTPFGLRSLARAHVAYQGRYGGAPHQRDAAYHQGTVWSWLLGPFARAHLRVHGDAQAAHAVLEPLAGHLRHAGLGHISEIFDGDAPHHARGCFAQAWSVGSVLAAWHHIQARATAPTEVYA